MTSVSLTAPDSSTGVDWLTCTARHPHRVAALLAFGKDVVDQEVGSGGVAKGWHWQGFSGWTAGGAGYGFNGTGAIVRLSGATARELAADAIGYADNVSRLDVQITTRSDGVGNDYAKQLFASLAGVRRGRGRPISRSLIQTSEGGDSLYLGKRISDFYGRIYNKSLEEKERTKYPRWRYEVEIKGEPALANAKDYEASEDKAQWCASRVYRWFADRHCAPPVGALGSGFVGGASRGSDAQARRIQWLKVGVRPVVVALAAEYGWPDTLRWLGAPVAVSERYVNEVLT